MPDPDKGALHVYAMPRHADRQELPPRRPTALPPWLEDSSRQAWRRSARCVGRSGWSTLAVRDARHLTAGTELAADLVRHLDDATNGGAVRPTLTVLAPRVRVLNEQLVRYAGDPQYAGFAESLVRLGWQPSGDPFEPFPLAILDPGGRVTLHPLPEQAVLEVPISHPRLPWFAGLGLRWHAVPAISNMLLRLSKDQVLPVVFNGWYVSDEISARNLAGPDRYDVLPAVAAALRADEPGPAEPDPAGPGGEEVSDRRRRDRWVGSVKDRRQAPRGGTNDDTGDPDGYWRQRALVEVEAAVLWSFRRARVKISSPRQEAQRFVGHVAREQAAGRTVPTDWSWVISPIAPVLLPTYHRYYDPPDDEPGPDLINDPSLSAVGRDGWHGASPAGSDLAELLTRSATEAAAAGPAVGCPHAHATAVPQGGGLA